jgi:hypothetical protein
MHKSGGDPALGTYFSSGAVRWLLQGRVLKFVGVKDVYTALILPNHHFNLKGYLIYLKHDHIYLNSLPNLLGASAE